MHFIRFAPLEIAESCVRVAWTVEPATPLYTETRFTLDFGDALDPRTLPLKLWWTIVVMILHSHWNLLRSCRVVLPVTLPAREIEFWLRLLETELATLEMIRGTTDLARGIEIECLGPMLEEDEIPIKTGRHATAFSGGKDSLLQTALLCEFTERPLLVNVMAPMPPFRDHTWPFRQRALDEIVKRRKVELVVVKSDLNTIWPHYEIPHQLGYEISMGQLTHPSLYIAAALALAYAQGIESISLASEFEAFLVREYHRHAASSASLLAYSALTYGIYDRLFGRWGIQFGSVLAPLSHFQIQQLICQRYGDLLDLQISCFSMTDDRQQYCSRCFKCLRIAIMLMALGHDPSKIGLDLDVLFEAQKDYTPEKERGTGSSVKYALARMDQRAGRRFFPPHNVWQSLGWQDSPAFRNFKALAKQLAPAAQNWVAQQRQAYLRFVTPAFHAPLLEIINAYWQEPDPTDRSADLALINATVDWVTEPLKRLSAE